MLSDPRAEVKLLAISSTTVSAADAVNVPPVRSRVRRLSGGQRQAVAICRAAGFGSRIVIMDEPTAALGHRETARAEELIVSLRDRGLAVLLISHDFAQGGDIANAHELLLAHVREVVYTRSLPPATRRLEIVASQLGDRAGILGGAYLAIEHRLAPDALDAELERRIGSGRLAAWA